MFKVAYPWASLAEEEAEKKFLKTLPEAGREEIAGNVWVPPAKGSLLLHSHFHFSPTLDIARH